MESDALRVRLLAAELHERPVKLRLPFRFGVVTLTEAPQLFVRARIRLADGREGDGWSAELLVPKWFDKSPELTHEQNFDQLRGSVSMARQLFLEAGRGTPFGLSAAIEANQHAACRRRGWGGLIASFGLAMLDRAILDAACRIENTDIFSLVRSNRIGLTAATATDLAGVDLSAFLQSIEVRDSIAVRHTVGLADALTDAELGRRLNDGLPESLEAAVSTYGHRHFKLKVSGDVAADLDRLSRIAAVLDRIQDRYFVTLDGNEQFDSIDEACALWERMREAPRIGRLRSSILFIEQPIARARALSEPVERLAREIPLEIDESDDDIDAFTRARALGYRGVSSKACKGIYRALLNRARVTQWSTEGSEYFMSAEDLTTQAGIAVQQDFAQALLIGATHVERNGHHYVDGMAGAPTVEQEAFLRAHPDIYARTRDRARLAIRDGRVVLGSLQRAAGFGVVPVPVFVDAAQPSPAG